MKNEKVNEILDVLREDVGYEVFFKLSSFRSDIALQHWAIYSGDNNDDVKQVINYQTSEY